MSNENKIKIFHISGDHYIPTKTTMKIYNMLKNKLMNQVDICELLIDDIKLDTLKNCRGCKKCFTSGICIYDKEDAILEIKNKLLESDLIVISTPVFIDNISGNLKTLFDRLSYWFHIMPLIHKKCILIVSTYRSGKNEVSKYLYQICSYLGLEVVGLITSDYKTKKSDVQNMIDICIDVLISKLTKKDESSAYVRHIFNVYDTTYKNMMKRKQKNFELTLWYRCHYKVDI